MQDINGKTRVCGLIGNPVEHTLSPLIHNTVSEKMNINLAYVPFLVENDRVEDAVRGAYALNILGMNVTVPHKQRVIDALKEIDPLAARIGAVNTLVRVDGGYRGYNTDMLGLLRMLKEDGVELEDREVIVLGAGGVARAVAVMCAMNKVRKVYMLNRSVEKAQAIAGEVNEFCKEQVVCALPLSEYQRIPKGKYPVIQATSVGLAPKVDEAVIEDEEFYEYVNVGVDLIYNPYTTKFMKLVEKAGGKAFNGLKMLLYQGIIAYELWNELQVDEETARLVYIKMKEAMGIHE